LGVTGFDRQWKDKRGDKSITGKTIDFSVFEAKVAA
jgi:hypothetical protein